MKVAVLVKLGLPDGVVTANRMPGEGAADTKAADPFDNEVSYKLFRLPACVITIPVLATLMMAVLLMMPAPVPMLVLRAASAKVLRLPIVRQLCEPDVKPCGPKADLRGHGGKLIGPLVGRPRQIDRNRMRAAR